MYDSRTDQPRTVHAHYYCREPWTAPVERVTKTQAIAEGLDEHEVEADEAAHLNDGLDYSDYAKALFWEQDEPKPEPKPKLRTARVLLERDEPAKNIRRPRVAKQPFSRTTAQAARQDGVDTAVYTRSINTNA